MPENKFYFSVVIPLYNKEDTIVRSINSVLNQTVHDFEIIVVNDGSTDKGPDIVAAINDSRIRLIHQDNQGVSAARNRAIAETKHELIAFLDADDEWLPTFLATINRLVTLWPDCGLYATSYFYKTPTFIQQLASIKGIPDNFEGILENYFFIACQGAPPICTSATCVKKNKVIEIGGFPAGIGLGEDLLTWARIALTSQIAFSKQPLAIYYRRSAESRIVPLRPPPIDDYVGRSLNDLLKKNNQAIGLRQYIEHWHTMRLHLFAELEMYSEAKIEFLKIVHINPFNFKAFFWLFIARLPKTIANISLKLLVKMKFLE